MKARIEVKPTVPLDGPADLARAYTPLEVPVSHDDQPNQINNVLVFPGMFRGLIDGGLSELTTAAQQAAARAIAGTVDEPGPDQIVPSVFDDRLVPAIARAVAEG